MAALLGLITCMFLANGRKEASVKLVVVIAALIYALHVGNFVSVAYCQLARLS